MVIYIILISSVFLISDSMNTYVLYYRFLYFAIIPTVIVLAYFYSNNILPKFTKTTINTGIVSTVYLLVYALYCSTFNT